MITGIYIGDVGTKITLECNADISAATKVEIHATSPSGLAKTWDAIIEDTSIYHIVQAGEINQAGTWTLRAYVELPAWQGHGDPETMLVG